VGLTRSSPNRVRGLAHNALRVRAVRREGDGEGDARGCGADSVQSRSSCLSLDAQRLLLPKPLITWSCPTLIRPASAARLP
jgi:hypothetical protein